MMRYLFYNVVITIIAPVAALYLICSRKYRPLLRRFWPSVPAVSKGRVVWVHACSVGEVMVAKVLISKMRACHSDCDIVLTVSTLSGYEIAATSLPGVPLAFAPFDLCPSVRGFVARLRPEVLILLETEVWPNLVRESRRLNVPVVVVNGRISPRKYPKYRRYRWLMPPVFSWLSHVAVQGEVYRQRYMDLGVPQDCVSVTGNLKCDGVPAKMHALQCAAMRKEFGFGEEDLLVVFGSTRPRDEGLALSCWKSLETRYPTLRFIVAPRHLTRLDEARAIFAGEDVVLRSDLKAAGDNAAPRVVFLDTMGELSAIYGMCQAAVIGGSFFPGVEGHNPLEPAALGVATVFGPYMGNFPDAVALLLNAGGAVQVSGPEALAPLLERLLQEPEYRDCVGRAGRQAVLESQGATDRTVALISRYLT